MRGDGHAGEKLLLTAKGSVPDGRASHTEKRVTVIGLTALDGTSVLCVLIIQAMNRDLLVEIGIGITVNSVGKQKRVTPTFSITQAQESMSMFVCLPIL